MSAHPLIERARQSASDCHTRHIDGGKIKAWRWTERHGYQPVGEYLNRDACEDGLVNALARTVEPSPRGLDRRPEPS